MDPCEANLVRIHVMETHSMPSRSHLVRLALFALLLLIEAGLLLSCFSTSAIQESQHPLLAALSSAWLLPKFAVPVLAAALLFGKERLQQELKALHDPEHKPWLFAALQVAAFLGLFATSIPVLQRADESWIATWLALASLTGGLSILILASPKRLAAALRRNVDVLAGAVVIGGAAFVAGRYSTSSLWEPLRVSTLIVVYELLSLITNDVLLDAPEFVLGTKEFICRISPECSGFEGIGLIVVFLGSALWIFREHFKFPQAWLLLLLGIVVIWLANALRIVALICIGTWISPRLAIEGFHSVAGIASFCMIGLGLLAFARRSSFFSKTIAKPLINWTGVYLAPLMLATAVALMLGPFSNGLDTLYPLRPLALAGLLFLWRDRLPKIHWVPSAAAVGYGVFAFAIWMGALAIRNGAPTEIPIQAEWQNLPLGWAAFWIVFRIAGTVWMAPWTEELAFRGYLMRRLSDPEFERVSLSKFAPVAVIVSSLLFGITHDYWIAATLCGALYATAQIRGRSISDAVCAHAVTNGLLVVYAFTTGNWSVWL